MSLTEEAPRFRIKAGIMNTTPVAGGGGKLQVTPDNRPGYLEITANASEGVLNISWRTRNAQEPSFTIILTADKLRFSKVDTGKDEDRVYVLFSESREHRRFFWLQEPDASGDEAKVKKLREMLKRPPRARAPGGMAGLAGMPGSMALMQALAAGSRRPGALGSRHSPGAAGGAPAPGASGLGDIGDDEASMIRQLLAASGALGDDSATDEMMGVSGSDHPPAAGSSSSSSSAPAPAPAPASSPAPAPAPAPAPGPGDDAEDEAMGEDDGVEGGEEDDQGTDLMDLSQEDLAQLAAHTEGMPAELQAMLLQQLMASRVERSAPLSYIINADDALAVATASDAVATSLAAELPEGQQDPSHLEAAIRSPQLAQALRSLSAALSTDNFETIFANFGLDPTAGADLMARGDAVGAFLAALQAKADADVAAAGGAAASSSSSSSGDAAED